MRDDLNRVTLMGYLGSDAGKKSKTTGAPVTFRMATTKHRKGDDGKVQSFTSWHNVVVFNNLAKYAIRLKKGDRVYVEAELQDNNYPKTVGGETVTIYTTAILATQIERLSAKEDSEENPDSEPNE